MRELEDPRRRKAGGFELSVRSDDPVLSPGGRVVARERPELLDLPVLRLGDPVELDIVARDAVVWVAGAVPLMGVAVSDEDSALPLQVLQSRDELGCVSESQLTRFVLAALRVPVVGADTEPERDSVRVQVVGGGSQIGGVGPRVDVLQPDERPMAFSCSRSERVEQEVREDEVPIGLARVHERQLADVGEVARADGPRERRSVAAYGVGEHRARTRSSTTPRMIPSVCRDQRVSDLPL